MSFPQLFPPYPVLNTDGAIPVVDNIPMFRAKASLRFTDETTFNQVLSDYAGVGLVSGLNVLFGVSPQTLITRYGVAYTDNPASVDYDALTPIGRIFTNSSDPDLNDIQGHAASVTADGIQYQTGVSYTDPNGQVFDTVSWCWEVEVSLYRVADVGKTWDQQVIQYTGDGTSNRLIPTTFALDSGNVAIWIFPKTSDIASFRHNAMSGTTMSAAPIETLGGIMAFQSGGFTVTDHGATKVNTNGAVYTALVFKASDVPDSYMSFGFYSGIGALTATGTFTLGSRTVTLVSGVTTADIGRAITIDGTITDTITGVSGTTITIGSPATVNGSKSITAVAGGQRIEPDNQITPASMIWVFGRGGTGAFWTDLMPNGQSTSFGVEAKATTDQIVVTDPTATHFGLGASNNVNSNTLVYYYCAFHIPVGETIRATMFTPFTVAGTGSAIAKTGLGFSPSFASIRVFDATLTTSLWRSLAQLTTHSTSFDGIDSVSGGITSLDADGLTMGATVVPNGYNGHGFAVKGTGSGTGYETPTYVNTETMTNPDGTVSLIQTLTESQTPPDEDSVLVDPADSPQWWCNADFGYSVYQIDSPGDGWIACVGPTSDNGWYLSTNDFGGQTTIVSAGTPADPRPWTKIATWAVNNTGMLGGSPGAAAMTGQNSFVYPASGYTVGTDYPPIRIFNGRSDKELCRIPPTTANVIPKAVMSMLAANGTVYLTTWDSGTTSADWAGRVFQLDTETGVLTVLGTVFAAGEMPYALAWHMGRLWCGTNNGIGTVGKVYYFRPGIDTAWTLDYTTSTSSAGGVDSLVSYKGKLYVGTDNAAASRGKVLVRDTAGAYTTSLTGTGGTARINNGYLQLTVFGTNLYAAYWNNDSPSISKIEKFDGSSWTTAYTGAGDTIKPFIQLVVDNDFLYAFGGGNLLAATILSTSNGTSWTDLTDELPETDETLLPMFGVVVL